MSNEFVDENGNYIGPLIISESLDLTETQITQLPDVLQVGGRLYLSGTQIKRLPDDLLIGTRIYK